MVLSLEVLKNVMIFQLLSLSHDSLQLIFQLAPLVNNAAIRIAE
jgi:hypothetical protein